MQEGKQYILGISAHYHDASAALICDGEVIAAIAEERISRIKHDKSFPVLAIRFCLEQAGITAAELTRVVFYEDTALKFSRILVSAFAGFPRSWNFFREAMQRWLTGQLWTKMKICKELDISPDVVTCVSHHISHAAHAFFNSPFEKAGVVIVDATGEWTCSSIARCDRRALQPIRIEEEVIYPQSIGLLYAAITAFLGFSPNNEECSTMALAAYGQPVFADFLRDVLQGGGEVSKSGKPAIDVTSLDSTIFNDAFIRILGKPVSPGYQQPFSCFTPASAVVDADAIRLANIASSMQQVLEENLFAMAEKTLSVAGTNKLCVGGGVANNCVAIQKLADRYGSDNVFVPLDPGDGGSAIGAAMAGYFSLNKKSPVAMVSPYPGNTLQTEKLENILEYVREHDWSRYLPETARPFSARDLVIEVFQRDADLLAATSKQLMQGSIVGWAQGRAEFGPRALGNRSILAMPTKESALRLGQQIKKRAAFKPYGVSLTEDAARKILVMRENIPLAALNMQMTMDVKETFHEPLAGVLAIDGTTRPHVCMEHHNPVFHGLLCEIEKRAGLAALLNTSFNEPGSPVIATAFEAMMYFVRSDLDVVVLDNLMIRKPWCR